MSGPARLKEWEIADLRSEPALRCGPLSPEAAARVATLNRAGPMEILEVRDGLRVTTRSYVGSIDLGPITLQIRPKIAADLVPVFMRYALSLDAATPSANTATPIQAFSFVDLVGLLLRDEIDALIQAGLLQDYQSSDAWLSSPKGRVLFEQLARQPSGTRVAAPCRFIRRTPDVLLNRIALSAVAALRPAVEDSGLAFELHTREALLGELCRPLALSRSTLEEARATIDRRSRYYEPMLRLAELICDGLGPAFEGERSTALPGFLFDMNGLFERFVARLCREYAPRGKRVEAQESLARAYRYRANPHRWQVPRLRPDLVVRAADGTPLVVLDTKYKLLEGSLRPSPADLYQLTLYSVAFGHETYVPARIIYPIVGPCAAEPVLEFLSFRGQKVSACVSVFGLDLHACASALRRRDRPALERLVADLVTPP